MPSLVKIFQQKLIPWAEHDLEQRLIIARPEMSKRDIPFGAELTHAKIPGKRVLVRTREEGAQKVVRAYWPEAGLHEVYTPKLVCVLKGRTDYRAGDYIISCNEGHFILLPPFVANTTGRQSHLEGESRKYGSCDILQLILMQDHINCTACSSRGAEHWGTERYLISRKQVLDFFRLFIEEAQNPQIGSEMLLNHVLVTALTLVWREIVSGRYDKSRSHAPESTLESSRSIEQLRDHIISNLSQSPTIEKVAQAMYMSPSQFTRYVRERTGCSFVEILTELRIEESKRLLRETDWSIAAIARHIGLRSDTYFMGFFKKQTSLSPTEYRSKEKINRK